MPPETRSVGRVLFVMAHSDDEFGIMGRMLQLRDLDAEIWCVWTACGQGRAREARNAMREIGVSEDRLRFLSLGGLGDVASLRRNIAALREMLSARPFDEVYVPAYEGGHYQHDLTHFAALQAVREVSPGAPVFEYPLYNLAGGRVNPFRLIPLPGPVCGLDLSRQQVNLIRGSTRHYPSQRRLMTGFKYLMPSARQCRPRWRPVPAWDYSKPPHRGLLWHDLNPRTRRRPYREAVTAVIGQYRVEAGTD